MAKKEIKDNIPNLDKFIKIVEDILNNKLENILENRQINKEELVFKVEEFYSNKDTGFIEMDIQELIKELKILSLEQKAKDMENDLNNIEILTAYNQIKIQIEDIKNGRFNFY